MDKSRILAEANGTLLFFDLMEKMGPLALKKIREIRVCELISEIKEAYAEFEARGGHIGMHRDGTMYATLDGKDVSAEHELIVNSIDLPVVSEFERMGGIVSVKPPPFGKPHFDLGLFAISAESMEAHGHHEHTCLRAELVEDTKRKIAEGITPSFLRRDASC